MVTSNNSDKVTQLETFVEKLQLYQIDVYKLKQGKIKGSKVGQMELLREELLQMAGSLKSLITDLTNKETFTVIKEGGQQYSYNIWFTGLGGIYGPRTSDAISHCVDVAMIAIGKLKDEIRMSIRDREGRLITSVVQPPSAFIAHEGESQALTKLREFLDALGVKYLIAEKEASNGRSVEKQVEWTSGQADFAIILATKGVVVDKQTRAQFMGMNVADELGRAR